MAASSASHSYNSALSMASTVGGSYTEALVEITDISDDLSVEPVKVTHLKSDSAAHEYIPGLIEPESCSLELNFVKGQLTHVMSLLRTNYFYKITDSDGSITAFKGFYTKWTKKTTVGNHITLSISVKKSGLPTFTAAA